jgi:hypothetical protein
MKRGIIEHNKKQISTKKNKKQKTKKEKIIIVENEGLYGSVMDWNMGKYARIPGICHL